jgi:hypothetical protein
MKINSINRQNQNNQKITSLTMKPKSVGAVVDTSTLRNRAGASEQGTKTGSCAEEESSVLMQSWQFVPEKPAAHVHV